MSVKWTDEQKSVIYSENGNLLVSAAAGSGKTAVLVERVIESVAGGKADISNIVLFTFTNASAAELKQRISDGLEMRFRDTRDALLDEQIKLLPMSSIGTIHSFCSNLLRNNFTKTSLPKSFRIGEEAELSMLFKKAFDKAMDEQYESANEDFFDMAEAFCGKNREDFEKLIKSILNYSKALPNPAEWLHSCSERLNSCAESVGMDCFGVWVQELIKHSRLKAEGIKSMYEEIINASSLLSEKYYSFFEAESKIAERISLTLDGQSWDGIYTELRSIVFASMPRKTKDTDEDLLNFIKMRRDCIKKEVKYLREKIFYADSQKAASHIIAMQRHIAALVDTVCKTEEYYAKFKRRKNLVDFNDLEQLSIKLLENDSVSPSFTDIYVDEYQDTNAAQNRLFELLSPNADLFAVGDVKQSIYGFRNARPQNFLEREALYTNSDSGKMLCLSKNFRSHGNIIAFINGIFENIMSSYVGDVSYNENHRLKAAVNIAIDSRVEINILEKKLKTGQEASEAVLDLAEDYAANDAALREARFTARRIYDLVEVEKPLVFDKSKNVSRPIEYGDVAVLMRKTKGSSKLVSGCLAELGIPVICEENTGYFASHEVKLLLSMLEIIDNPYRDIPLLTVMRSPAFAFTDDELARIRLDYPDGAFYEAVMRSDDDKCIRLKNELQLFRDKYEVMSLYELVRFILDRTGYEKFAAVLSNPTVRKANILLLCDKASEFEKNGRRSLFEFIQYIKNMIRNNFDFSVSKSFGLSGVRIMSIHKSKGLEFPAVFLVNTASQFNFTDLRRNVLYDSDLGIASDCIVKSRMIKYTNAAKQAMLVKKKAEILSEEMRILYVALTRAKYYLFVSGSVPDTDKFKEKFENSSGGGKSLFYRVSTYSDFLSWIMCGLPNALADVNYVKASDISNCRSIGNFSFVRKIDLGSITPDRRLQSEFDKRLSFIYSTKTPQPSKFSVSDIHSASDESAEFKFKSPLFCGEKNAEVDDTLFKKTLHFIVQNLDLGFVSSADEIYAQIRKMVSLDIISELYADKIKRENIEKIYGFFRSNTGRAFLCSGFRGREYRFFTYLDNRDLFGDLNNGGETLVQGVIDCFFEQKGKIVIVNYINKNNSRRIYEKALAKVLGREVSRTITVDIY